MKTLFIVFLSVVLTSLSAEIKVVTEYRYPTSYQVIPVTQTDKNGNARITGGMVIPQDFKTREVGASLSVSVEVGQLGGIASITDGIKMINGNTDLMMAATSGNFESTKKIVSKSNVNNKNRYGSTALMGAAAGGNEKIVKLLLSYGADVNMVSSDGNSALKFAKKNGNEGIVKLLLDSGAKS